MLGEPQVALLRFLADVGFDGVPRVLRHDPSGTSLSFVPGEVPDAGPYSLSDARILSAVGLIRAFHDATVPLAAGTGFEVVCHGDLGPHNTVFAGEAAVGLIDFDEDTRPGFRVDDVAHAAWGFADLARDEIPVAEQARKLDLICREYPGISPSDVVASLAERFERARLRHEQTGLVGAVQVFSDLSSWLERHRGDLL